MPRTLTTELVRDPNNEINQLVIRIDGWRIDINTSDMAGWKNPSMVNIANELLDGACASWCACAYDASVPDADLKDLILNGSERE